MALHLLLLVAVGAAEPLPWRAAAGVALLLSAAGS
jgi:hypothetical protein